MNEQLMLKDGPAIPHAAPGVGSSAFVYLDADLRVIAADRTMLGWCAREQAESRLGDLVRDHAYISSERDVPATCEWTLPTSDGGERRLHTRFVPVLDSDRRARGLIAHSWELCIPAQPASYAVDLSPLAGSASDPPLVIDAHATLDTTRLYLSDFVAALGHELRNPLAALAAALRLLEHPQATADMMLRARQIIDRKCRDLTHIADDLSTMSRSTRADVPLMRAPIGPATLLRNVCAELAAHAQACGVSLVDAIDPDADLGPLQLDVERCHKALRMTLLGAIEAALSGNRILVALRGGPDGWVVSLADAAQTIVDAYVRLRPGAGAAAVMPETLLHLGLGNLLRIVELHGARVGLAVASNLDPAALELRFAPGA